MVESVQQHHPDLGVTEIVKMLNIAQEEYSQRTRMLEKATQFDLSTDQRYYALDDAKACAQIVIKDQLRRDWPITFSKK